MLVICTQVCFMEHTTESAIYTPTGWKYEWGGSKAVTVFFFF